ncbi:MAG: putative Diphthine methyl ester synthase [Streblomastix strix]|uniref:diphthine methyl ester synthase n=1 Tax=Streblomastix strix TaxID=222440 RepID=A0A5J4WZB9_9EUKA|nr:MAG: putative Diphthine methyl ester synthase [Streblomastix strix]
MLFFIGLGLGSAKDITLRGLEIVKHSKKVYLEGYTSVLESTRVEMEELYGREILIADREFVEQNCDEMINEALTDEICFLVVGDVFCATTHCDLYLRAVNKGVKVSCIHNAGIMTAVGCCGLQLYNFGRTVSIPFFTDKWRPSSFYDKIKSNLQVGMHTLCLLDIKVKEQSIENLVRGLKIYEPPRYMSINTAIQQLFQIEEEKKQGVLSPTSICVGLARVGWSTQQIVVGEAQKLLALDFGEPLHSLIIPACDQLCDIEREMLEHFTLK